MPFFLLFLFFSSTLFAGENFIFLTSEGKLYEQGKQVDKRLAPACSFNIAISLMGFEEGIIQNEEEPVWSFQEGFDDSLEVWKKDHNPTSWMKNSVVWYSRLIAKQLGAETMQHYLTLFQYGNEDLSGGHKTAWIRSSLKISPREQMLFMKKIAERDLPLSDHTYNMTRAILFKEEFHEGWKLFGKTGLNGFVDEEGHLKKVGWLVGWIEKGDKKGYFAYNIQDSEINDNRLKRVEQLILETEFWIEE